MFLRGNRYFYSSTVVLCTLYLYTHIMALFTTLINNYCRAYFQEPPLQLFSLWCGRRRSACIQLPRHVVRISVHMYTMYSMYFTMHYIRVLLVLYIFVIIYEQFKSIAITNHVRRFKTFTIRDCFSSNRLSALSKYIIFSILSGGEKN